MNDSTLAERYGPWAVIAGGSEGVGAEFAALLAADGVNLVLLARKPEPLRDTAERCRALGIEVRTAIVDLTAPTMMADVDAVVDDLDVGLLIVNAGANSYRHEVAGADLAGLRSVVELNVMAPLALAHRFAGPLAERGRGGILIVGSMSGFTGSAGLSVYGGSKAFSRIFTEGLWVELREHGVDVLQLILGATRTPAMARVGLNFDAMDDRVSDSRTVAELGLQQLPHGPVQVIESNALAELPPQPADRAATVLENHRLMQRLMKG
ncbi:SDR family NAD(P)-dependent oxidoreductase [Jongsikchunia kroppenstedtii]|uniref:SDR family NAD(P)-dependent oxidoreductase n=1 Tax=Jongsikchunia kroppenstedtii TaxID=1121721 RepID=UPI00035DB86A|nr:SDR family NAD(P)-dependent oxidoreductase [Jongsikchunia kroppenstedtii]